MATPGWQLLLSREWFCDGKPTEKISKLFGYTLISAWDTIPYTSNLWLSLNSQCQNDWICFSVLDFSLSPSLPIARRFWRNTCLTEFDLPLILFVRLYSTCVYQAVAIVSHFLYSIFFFHLHLHQYKYCVRTEKGWRICVVWLYNFDII